MKISLFLRNIQCRWSKIHLKDLTHWDTFSLTWLRENQNKKVKSYLSATSSLILFVEGSSTEISDAEFPLGFMLSSFNFAQIVNTSVASAKIFVNKNHSSAHVSENVCMWRRTISDQVTLNRIWFLEHLKNGK